MRRGPGTGAGCADAEPHLEGRGEWDWAPVGGGAFGSGDPEVHQEGKSITGKEGSHSAV